jgi:hypothetical protein
VAGVAGASMTTPENDSSELTEGIERPATTSTSIKEKPSFEEEVKDKHLGDDSPTKIEEPTQPSEDEKEQAGEEDVDPPDLVVLFPQDGQHFTEKKLAFEGRTEPGARVFAGTYEADVDEKGNWRIVLILTQDGANVAKFKAVDGAGNESTASVKAFYDAPKEVANDESKDTEHKDYEFSAQQKYGSCSEAIPYDKWYGTGAPGTKVWIGSEFGSSKTVIGESGEWFLKVEFPQAPCGETFTVVLETDKGHRKVFEFTRFCESKGEETHDGK